ncbi:GlxA family transcriptional regulator [Salmonella enterica]
MKKNELIGIGIVRYNKAQLSAILGLTDLFYIANRLSAAHSTQGYTHLYVSHWEWDIVADLPSCTFQSDPGREDELTAIILPPTLSEPISGNSASAWLDWLQQHHAKGSILGSVCAGAFLLGETRLLDGREVTTHWTYAEQFQARFPSVRLNADRLIIDDGDIITAGGAMSWTDLGLRLVERFLGPIIMLETARMLLVDPPGREQRYYSVFNPKLTHGDAAILKVQHWLQVTEAAETSLPILAKRANLELRTFQRRFRKATGMTITEYCQRLRVGKARELLQFSTLSLDRIAWQIGYSDSGAFRKVFTKFVGLSPSDYRRRFNARQQSDH